MLRHVPQFSHCRSATMVPITTCAASMVEKCSRAQISPRSA
jgi:hypothetical protein